MTELSKHRNAETPADREVRVSNQMLRACLVAWLAVMLYFLFGTTLPIFRGLARDEAGEAVALLFPPYYVTTQVLGGAGAALAFAARRTLARPRWVLGAALAGLLCMVCLKWGIAPIMADLKEAGDREGFGRWHGISMVVNLAGMIAVAIGALLAAPRKAGTRGQ